MKNTIKHFRLLLLIVVILIFMLLLVGCWDGFICDCNKSESDAQTIDLTIDNFEYYLSISKVLTDSVSAAGMRFSSYTVTVLGAISGLYQDCSIYYKIGDGEEREIKLNAQGFAEFSYSVGTNTGNFEYTRVKGKIVI